MSGDQRSNVEPTTTLQRQPLEYVRTAQQPDYLASPDDGYRLILAGR